MCSFRFPFVALCLSTGMFKAADQPKLSPAQQEVINAHEARTESRNKRDQAVYSRYAADDYIFSGDDGSVLTNIQLMASVGKFPMGADSFFLKS